MAFLLSFFRLGWSWWLFLRPRDPSSWQSFLYKPGFFVSIRNQQGISREFSDFFLKISSSGQHPNSKYFLCDGRVAVTSCFF
jgi:hypothetical protein